MNPLLRRQTRQLHHPPLRRHTRQLRRPALHPCAPTAAAAPTDDRRANANCVAHRHRCTPLYAPTTTAADRRAQVRSTPNAQRQLQCHVARRLHDVYTDFCSYSDCQQQEATAQPTTPHPTARLARRPPARPPLALAELAAPASS
jgi:hypothetical protein